MKSLYIQPLWYWLLFGIVIIFALGFLWGVLFEFAKIVLALFVLISLADVALLYHIKQGVQSSRELPEKLSNGDENPVRIALKNLYPFGIKINIIDEIPFQFQKRDFLIKQKIKKNDNTYFSYNLTPKQRGEYHFGNLNIYVISPIGLVSRRYQQQKAKTLACYPSFIRLPEYELIALKNEFLLGGIKKIRKIGTTLEFEQIKDYVQGDDIRTINWKATGKMNRLMVNQYQEERSQRIYMLIDQGRTMKMPFDWLSLLDYSINASMALSHIVLKKKDHAGVAVFSRKIEQIVKADQKSFQLKRIANVLYNVSTDFVESDFNRLYTDLRYKITRRSLFFLFSNFETLDALYRQLPYLRAISKNHILVVIFFKNKLLKEMVEKTDHENMQQVYDEIIAEKFEYEKKLIRQELSKYGIQSIYTLPEDLSVGVINKYLEIKARGIL
ncbi:DUF58 domain-containing protein [Ornithobacterium rhinotracheale]|uniref:DUF58 domain-containing protein n=1 Tax=Ornithobacterium rhinotracheale TaxID=28251 RepID=A0A410JUH7_ORNRH|nr:DUF58 domain-containing protein [Ornithobacterium rhinotracheale]